jgi:hypothetical protein
MIRLFMIGFALWVTSADQPAYKRATFGSYQDCVTAARAQVESLGPDVSWQCIATENHRGVSGQ